jgi:hypothetical protein
VTQEEFEKASGVGIVVTDEEIQSHVNKLFEDNKEEIMAKGYDY